MPYNTILLGIHLELFISAWAVTQSPLISSIFPDKIISAHLEHWLEPFSMGHFWSISIIDRPY